MGSENTSLVSILHKSLACRYRPVRVADGPITTSCRFIKNACWVEALILICTYFILEANYGACLSETKRSNQC